MVDYPTKDYISQHDAAYSDATKKTWADAGYTWPKNTAVSIAHPPGYWKHELTRLMQWDRCTA